MPPVRITIDCERGALAADPETALSGLVELAKADGADPHEWVEKAFRAHGAVEMSVEVSKEPTDPMIGEAVEEAIRLYDHVMFEMREKLLGRLREAAGDVDLAKVWGELEGG